MNKSAPLVKAVSSDADILKCWPAVFALRPHLLETEFLEKVRRQMVGGYSMAFVEIEGEVAGFIGWRSFEKLFDGKQIYIDDLGTLPEFRSCGCGSALLEHVFELARTLGCACVTLDSGPTRHDAHRLYLNKGFRINSMHFIKTLYPA